MDANSKCNKLFFIMSFRGWEIGRGATKFNLSDIKGSHNS